MEVRAVAKYIRVQPRKVRQIAKEISGKPAVQSANLLQFHPSKGAAVLRKVLISAISNAEANHNMDAGTLNVARIMVDEGPRIKRIQARAMGRANRIVKKTSHVTVIVQEGPVTEVVKPHGTKAKARPTFATAAKGKKKAAKKEDAPVTDVVEETPVEAAEETVAEQQAEATPVEETVAEAAPEAETAAEEPSTEEETS